VSLVLPAAATLAVLAATGVMLTLGDESPPSVPASSVGTVTGLVVGDAGKPIAGATVWLDKARVTTGADGRFTIAHDGAGVVTASAPGHLPRTVAIGAGGPSRIRLSGDADHTVSLRFGGDVMFGRRYYAGSENTRAPLRPGATADDIASVLKDVQPFLDDADLSVVNLETALVDTPWTDVDGPRPKTVHPTKDLVITSSTKAARALADSGVDIVSLSNNHSFDGLDSGISSTVAALDAAGVRHYGAGRTADEAWRPAVVDVKGQRIAFVGCTNVDGRAHPISYVAEGNHGGAAACEEKRLQAAVRAARRQAAYVVVTIHGGVEYRRSQTVEVRALADAAHSAGARLVVGSHPHVVGGIVHKGDNVFVETMGNLAFDQELWATLPSYLARVDVRAGATVAADTDAVVLDDYHPRPAVGTLAASIARVAAGWVDGGALLSGTRASVPLAATDRPATPPPARTARATLGVTDVRQLAPGWWLAPATDLASRVRAGTDQLFGTGTFEADVVGSPDLAPLWSVAKYGTVTAEASCDPAGGRGLMLARSPLSEETAVAATRHRVPAAQGRALTLTAKVRYASEGSRLEVHWYDDFTGASTSTSRVDIPKGAWDRGACQTVRFDVVVPRKAVAAQVFVVLDPPKGGQIIRRFAVDDIMLVDWAPKGRSGRRYDVVEGLASGPVTFAADDPVTAATPLMP
jgi:poly-gamma-glutamate synthesis protein (capsule biosynthesis protein)